MRSAAEEHPIILCQARHNIALLALSSATGILPRPDGGTCDCWAGHAELGTVHVVDLSTDIHLLGPSGAGAARRSRDHYAVRVSPRLDIRGSRCLQSVQVGSRQAWGVCEIRREHVRMEAEFIGAEQSGRSFHKIKGL